MMKFRVFLNLSKEEKWLEEMAEKGYQLKSVLLAYHFYAAPKEKSAIRIDYRNFKSNKDYLDYLALFEDSGWKHIAGIKEFGAHYFKKVNPDADDDIFSDSLSRAGRYKRTSSMYLLYTFIFFFMFLTPAYQMNINKISNFFNPKSFYLTPGLWEMSGGKFWYHFLFETPYALMRGYGWILMVISFLLCLISLVKSHTLYKKALKEETEKNKTGG